jgi:hypothetical protein
VNASELLCSVYMYTCIFNNEQCSPEHMQRLLKTTLILLTIHNFGDEIV